MVTKINYSGWLLSNEYRRNALTENISAQVIMDGKRNLFLHINQKLIVQWFREQFRLSQKETQRKGITHLPGHSSIHHNGLGNMMLRQTDG